MEYAVNAKVSSRHSVLIPHFCIQDSSLEVQIENTWVHDWIHFIIVFCFFLYLICIKKFSKMFTILGVFPQVIVPILTVLFRYNWPTIGHIYMLSFDTCICSLNHHHNEHNDHHLQDFLFLLRIHPYWVLSKCPWEVVSLFFYLSPICRL